MAQMADLTDDFVLSVFRKPRLPGDHMRKPVFLIHFHFPDEFPSDGGTVKDKRGNKHWKGNKNENSEMPN